MEVAPLCIGVYLIIVVSVFIVFSGSFLVVFCPLTHDLVQTSTFFFFFPRISHLVLPTNKI